MVVWQIHMALTNEIAISSAVDIMNARRPISSAYCRANDERMAFAGLGRSVLLKRGRASRFSNPYECVDKNRMASENLVAMVGKLKTPKSLLSAAVLTIEYVRL